jgi:hypothetical protein
VGRGVAPNPRLVTLDIASLEVADESA